MIWQRTVGMRPEIQEYGCYYMSIAWHAARQKPRIVFSVNILNEAYTDIVDEGWMLDDCYVKRPDKIFDYFGVAMEYRGKREAGYICAPTELEINQWFYRLKNWHHFVAGDGRGHTTYDPWGISTTATAGDLVDKRVFRLL